MEERVKDEGPSGKEDFFLFLKSTFYSSFTIEEIEAIERKNRESYAFAMATPIWVVLPEGKSHIGLEDVGIEAGSPLSQKLAGLAELSTRDESVCAFANLGMASYLLEIPGKKTLKRKVIELAAKERSLTIIDVGSGGQAADIELAVLPLVTPGIAESSIRVIGVGGFDYGKELREEFQEVRGDVSFVQQNIYSRQLPGGHRADVVFSVKTAPLYRRY